MEKVYEIFKKFKMGNDAFFPDKHCNRNFNVYLSQPDYQCGMHCSGGNPVSHGSQIPVGIQEK